MTLTAVNRGFHLKIWLNYLQEGTQNKYSMQQSKQYNEVILCVYKHGNKADLGRIRNKGLIIMVRKYTCT